MTRSLGGLRRRLTRAAALVDWPALALVRDSCALCAGRWQLRLAASDIGVRCLACGATPVTQSLVAVLAALPIHWAAADACELSAEGPLVDWLRARTRSLATSEFHDGVAPGLRVGEVRNEDVEALSYPDAGFDLATSTEVFEHVGDDRRGFAEIRRVLRPGGWWVFTVPLFDAAATVERYVRDGEDWRPLLAEQFHADRRGRRVPVRRDYGRDIVERLLAAGFAEARIELPEHSWAGQRRPVVVAKAP